MFQSFWNVAAAFCVHEKQQSVQTQSHFGHHATASCESKRQETAQNQSVQAPTSFDFSAFAQDDHSDHLPSFAQMMLTEVQQSAESPIFIPTLTQAQFNWQNLYQSPDLFSSNPPPVLTPL